MRFRNREISSLIIDLRVINISRLAFDVYFQKFNVFFSTPLLYPPGISVSGVAENVSRSLNLACKETAAIKRNRKADRIEFESGFLCSGGGGRGAIGGHAGMRVRALGSPWIRGSQVST